MKLLLVTLVYFCLGQFVDGAAQKSSDIQRCPVACFPPYVCCPDGRCVPTPRSCYQRCPPICPPETPRCCYGQCVSSSVICPPASRPGGVCSSQSDCPESLKCCKIGDFPGICQRRCRF